MMDEHVPEVIPRPAGALVCRGLAMTLREPNRGETSYSLLGRLQLKPEEHDWKHLVDLYTPLINGWLRQQGLLHSADLADLVQEVLAVVVRTLPEFRHTGQPGAFRAWLRTIAVHRLRDFWRARRYRPTATGDSDFLDRLDRLEDPHSDLSRLWDEEHDRHVMGRLLELVRSQVKPNTWQAFHRVVIEGATEEEAAAELGMSVNAVCIAKSRVLARLRRESDGLVG